MRHLQADVQRRCVSYGVIPEFVVIPVAETLEGTMFQPGTKTRVHVYCQSDLEAEKLKVRLKFCSFQRSRSICCHCHYDLIRFTALHLFHATVSQNQPALAQAAAPAQVAAVQVHYCIYEFMYD